MGPTKTAETGGEGWPACGECGRPVRCGAVLGEDTCWCDRLPPLTPLGPGVAEPGDGPPACLCETCLRRRLDEQENTRS